MSATRPGHARTRPAPHCSPTPTASPAIATLDLPLLTLVLALQAVDLTLLATVLALLVLGVALAPRQVHYLDRFDTEGPLISSYFEQSTQPKDSPALLVPVPPPWSLTEHPAETATWRSPQQCLPHILPTILVQIAPDGRCRRCTMDADLTAGGATTSSAKTARAHTSDRCPVFG